MPLPLPDEIYGIIADTMDEPRFVVMQMTGLPSEEAVTVARARIRSGWSPTAAAWTEEEDDILRAGTNRTLAQLTADLPGRSAAAVKKRRHDIGASPGSVHGHADPNVINGRPMIAKTCTVCGRLRSAIWYGRTRRGTQWSSHCRDCVNARNRGRTPGRADSRKTLFYQEFTLPSADRHRHEYTDADMEVLADPGLTVVEKALKIRRTYYATSNAVANYGFASKPEPVVDDGVWAIDTGAEIVSTR